MNIKALAGKIGLNYDKTIEDFCGDVSALGAKLQGFASACEVENLKAAMDSGNNEAVRKAAYKIRKASEKVGLEQLAKLAERVEDAEESKIQAAYQCLIEKLEEVISILEKDE